MGWGAWIGRNAILREAFRPLNIRVSRKRTGMFMSRGLGLGLGLGLSYHDKRDRYRQSHTCDYNLVKYRSVSIDLFLSKIYKK